MLNRIFRLICVLNAYQLAQVLELEIALSYSACVQGQFCIGITDLTS